jgi:hypothetical protein
MSLESGELVWTVQGSGYKITPGKSQSLKNQCDELLEPVRVSEKGRRTYKPLDDPTLFLIFALTPPTPEGIRHFADQYGSLGLDIFKAMSLGQEAAVEGKSAHSGERVVDWTTQIHRMAKLVFAWMAVDRWKTERETGKKLPEWPLPDDIVELIRTPDLINGTEHLNWRDRLLSQLFALHLSSRSPDASWEAWLMRFTKMLDKVSVNISSIEDIEVRLFTFGKGQDQHFPELCGYQTRRPIAERISHRAKNDPLVKRQPVIYLAAEALLEHCLNIYMRDQAPLGLTITAPNSSRYWVSTPMCLLGALWFQFARAVVESRIFRACKECRKWFEGSRDEERTKHQFCGDACRIKAHRLKSERATTLFKNGIPLNTISENLDVTEERIKEWLINAGVWDPSAGEEK